MFDTVRLRTYNVIIEHEQLLQHNVVQSSTRLDEETGILLRYIQIKGEKIPFIKYSEAARHLDIEVSIPKCLFGENVSMVKLSDILDFYALLEQEMYDLFGVSINRDEWKVMRVDVCWNFEVGEKVQDYIRQLSLMKLPRMATHTINQVETVMFRNKSKKIMFYDKEKECQAHGCESEVTRKAKGVLRMEIKPADYEMKKYSESRKAVDLLTKDFFIYVTSNQTTFMSAFPNTEDVTFEFALQNNINKVERGIGFQQLKRSLGMGGLKQLYTSSTLANRQELVKELDMQSSLPPLEIDYSQL